MMKKMTIKNNLILILFLALAMLHLQGCSDSDNESNNIITPVNVVENEIVMYEANPRVFAQSGAINAISDRLDHIQRLGVNVLWLMPIYEQGILKSIGSPYCIKDYKKVSSEYGTLEDLKALVKKAHDRDMSVIMDWVANHTSWDNAWIQDKSWYTQDVNGNIISPEGTEWNDVADLNYDNANMRTAMLEAMKYWIQETGIDGYRCDYAEGVPDDFWQEAINELRKIKGGDLLMLAEGSDSRLFSDGFDILYGWDFAYKLQDVYAGKTTVANLYTTHRQEFQNIPEGRQRLRYTTNHDMAAEESPVKAYKSKQGAISAFVIATTLSGTPLIYSSQEIGYAEKLSFLSYNNIGWDSNPDYLAEYQKIMNVYNTSDALRKGNLKTYDAGKAACYYRTHPNQNVLVVVNTTDKELVMKVPIESAYTKVKNLMDNTESTLPSTLTLQPYQYFIWERQ